MVSASDAINRQPVKGVSWMIVATAFMVASDAIGKYLLQYYPVPQVVWARYFLHLGVVLIVCRMPVSAMLRTARVRLQLVRSSLLIGATLFQFSAIAVIPLTTAGAMMASAPVLVTMLSVAILREKVGLDAWISLLVGLAGALVIIAPGSEGWNASAVLAFCAAGCYALFQISTRALSRTENPQVTLTFSSLVGAVVMSAILPYVWAWPTLAHGALMVAIGILGALGHYCLVSAFADAPASTIAPFGYTNLIWAVIFDFVVFAQLPSLTVVGGACLIVAGGLYLTGVRYGAR